MNSQRYVLKLDDNSYNDIKWSQLDKNIPIEFELENYFYSDGDMARIEWEVNNQVYLIQSGDEVSIEEDNKVKNGEIVFETKNEVRAIVPPPRLSDDDITYPCELEDCEDMEGEDFAKDYELSLDDLILGQNDIFDK